MRIEFCAPCRPEVPGVESINERHELQQLRAPLQQVVEEIQQEIFRAGDHPALGIPTECAKRWLAALSSLPVAQPVADAVSAVRRHGA